MTNGSGGITPLFMTSALEAGVVSLPQIKCGVGAAHSWSAGCA
jgi:hypothetical protein